MDLCESCGHSWHGLTCEHKTSRLNSEYRYTVTEQCKCPGPFGIPTLDEGPRVAQKKGFW